MSEGRRQHGANSAAYESSRHYWAYGEVRSTKFSSVLILDDGEKSRSEERAVVRPLRPIIMDGCWHQPVSAAEQSSTVHHLKICSPVAAKNPPYRAMPGRRKYWYMLHPQLI